ncbi:hypothetical protein MHBO_004219 [Bonamia ostreae]|uniref:Uncharacterized protein n=1 Tax=Bonamia ostreae TaxID=126728 RepID=A0ABV2ASQ7_9EUKA
MLCKSDDHRFICKNNTSNNPLNCCPFITISFISGMTIIDSFSFTKNKLKSAIFAKLSKSEQTPKTLKKLFLNPSFLLVFIIKRIVDSEKTTEIELMLSSRTFSERGAQMRSREDKTPAQMTMQIAICAKNLSTEWARRRRNMEEREREFVTAKTMLIEMAPRLKANSMALRMQKHQDSRRKNEMNANKCRRRRVSVLEQVPPRRMIQNIKETVKNIVRKTKKSGWAIFSDLVNFIFERIRKTKF